MTSGTRGRVDVAGEWRPLARWGGVAALASAGLVVVQVALFVVWPPVHTVSQVYALMDASPALGLIGLDGLYIVNNIAVYVFYLGLATALWHRSRSGVALVLGLGTLQMAAYLASNPAVEMLALAGRHSRADPIERATLLAAGEAVLAGWKGTAFLVYYLLGAAVLLLIARLLAHSGTFSRATAVCALVSGLLMCVPSTFGTIGLVFSLLSLIPWCAFCVLGGRRLLELGRR